jgi:hypothetical protein
MRIQKKFPKYHMKILLRDFRGKVGREGIFKPMIGNDSLHEINNDNGVRVVDTATSKNLSKVPAKSFPIHHSSSRSTIRDLDTYRVIK